MKLSEGLKKSYAEGFKIGVDKFYPGYIAYEEYATDLEGIIDGKNVTIFQQTAEIQSKNNEIAVLGIRAHNLAWGLGIGVPVAVGVGILVGVLIKNAIDKK